MLGFRYYLLSPSHTDMDNIDRLNTVYETWATTFREVVEDAGGKFNPDDFYRHHFIGAVFYGEELVGFHLGTSFDLRLHSSKAHHFIQEMPAHIIEKITEKGIRSVLTIEYMNILPNWRRHNHDISWFGVLFALGCEVLEQSTCDGILCTPRVDRKAHEACASVGCYTLQEEVDKMGYPCAIMFHDKGVRKYPNAETKKWIDQLWKTRTDVVTATSIFTIPDNNNISKKAS